MYDHDKAMAKARTTGAAVRKTFKELGLIIPSFAVSDYLDTPLGRVQSRPFFKLWDNPSAEAAERILNGLGYRVEKNHPKYIG